mgnify:CR=1 FL=1
MYNCISDKIYDLIFIIEKLFINYGSLTINHIREILNGKYSIADIEFAINYLLVNRGIIVRDDFWSADAVYKYIADKYLHDSTYTRHYFSFEVDDNKEKKVLLISDTHIGNSELENYKMLHNIYEFSLQHGVTKCFHMGDIFSRVVNGFWKREDILNQFSLFEKYYPNFDEIKTYAIIGNHDEYINGFFEKQPIPFKHELRQLTRYVNNFYVIPRSVWELKLSNVMFHFSHRLYLNPIMCEHKLQELYEIANGNLFYYDRYNVLVSGHLHKGFIYNNTYDNKEQLFLGVPSATNINKNGVVAYIIDINNADLGNINNMNITLLLCDNNNKISEGETYCWNFKGKNKLLKKVF